MIFFLSFFLQHNTKIFFNFLQFHCEGIFNVFFRRQIFTNCTSLHSTQLTDEVWCETNKVLCDFDG